ncbi:hypothetical protein TRVL_03865 [Trypanosoma vivax]|nr:hypothetical protein TRVL_03865 [Trypanosoma vivax]
MRDTNVSCRLPEVPDTSATMTHTFAVPHPSQLRLAPHFFFPCLRQLIVRAGELGGAVTWQWERYRHTPTRERHCRLRSDLLQRRTPLVNVKIKRKFSVRYKHGKR